MWLEAIASPRSTPAQAGAAKAIRVRRQASKNRMFWGWTVVAPKIFQWRDSGSGKGVVTNATCYGLLRFVAPVTLLTNSRATPICGGGSGVLLKERKYPK